ncbi:MAG: GNAT family N-acetyltransferase [Nevskia sp.]|nr:GNAT family N-acetyltransferase [Nevskia sp.]
MSAVPAAAWDRCFPAHYPFTQHRFLAALEAHGCAVPETGWTPCHALVEDDAGELLGAAPLYLKTHSYGEFVFDFSWAQASQRLGRRYYPKLVSAIPFSPVTGPRLGASDPAVRAVLAQAGPAVAAASRLSSFHALFLEPADCALLLDAGCVERNDIQFHWSNPGYADFADFVAQLSSAKRKKLLRERRRVAEAGLRFEVRAGGELDEAQWAQVYALYCNTYEERGQPPYLSMEFFLDYGQAADSPLRLVLAYEERHLVAVAITLLGGDTLYGRHWGAAARYHSLHFETCYYQGIEYCIRQGLRRFDAGAQGEHKLSRGFVPVTTRSAHWLADPELRSAVVHALARERRYVGERGQELDGHSPFRLEDPAGEPGVPDDG